MKWCTDDLDKFDEVKEYIDTAVIPLAPMFSLDRLSTEEAKGRDALADVCAYAEKQLTGRVMLFPILHLNNTKPEAALFETDQFSFVQFVTTDISIEEHLLAQNQLVYNITSLEEQTTLQQGKELTAAIMECWKNEQNKKTKEDM